MTKPTYDEPSGGGLFTSAAETAWCCATVRDFVVIAPESDRWSIRWSAIGDATDWPTPGTTDARTKQAGSQVFPNVYGYVTGITEGEFYAYVFQERAVWKMSYVGGDVVWSFDRIEEGRGCHRVNRFDSMENAVFYESESGYHMIQNDVIIDIGYGIVDRTYAPT